MGIVLAAYKTLSHRPIIAVSEEDEVRPRAVVRKLDLEMGRSKKRLPIGHTGEVISVFSISQQIARTTDSEDARFLAFQNVNLMDASGKCRGYMIVDAISTDSDPCSNADCHQ